MPARPLRSGVHADIRIHSKRKLLCPTESNRDIGSKQQHMILEEVVETIFLRQPVVIVSGMQRQVIDLRNRVGQSDFGIEAAKIESRVIGIKELLLTQTDVGIQIFSNARLIRYRDHWG